MGFDGLEIFFFFTLITLSTRVIMSEKHRQCQSCKEFITSSNLLSLLMLVLELRSKAYIPKNPLSTR